MSYTRKGGGCGCSTWRGRGGFYPSVMTGLTKTGPYFIAAAFSQGARLVRNNRSRMAARRRGAKSRGQRTRSKRSLNTKKTRHTGK